MKVKLLKRLRKKCSPEVLHPCSILLLNKYPPIKRTMHRPDIVKHINRNRLWYKLLTTLTHK